jgi:PAS domain S-box-containing protein
VSEPTPVPALLTMSEAFAFLTEVRDYAIYMIDPDGRILTWNEGAHAIKGYTAEQIIGESFTRFFTDEDRTQGKPTRLLARGAAEGRIQDEGWRVRKDGSRSPSRSTRRSRAGSSSGS